MKKRRSLRCRFRLTTLADGNVELVTILGTSMGQTRLPGSWRADLHTIKQELKRTHLQMRKAWRVTISLNGRRWRLSDFFRGV